MVSMLSFASVITDSPGIHRITQSSPKLTQPRTLPLYQATNQLFPHPLFDKPINQSPPSAFGQTQNTWAASKLSHDTLTITNPKAADKWFLPPNKIYWLLYFENVDPSPTPLELLSFASIAATGLPTTSDLVWLLAFFKDSDIDIDIDIDIVI